MPHIPHKIMAGRAPPAALSATGLAFFSSLCASTFGLGCWQAQRYFEKIEMVAIREEEMKVEPGDSLEKDARCSYAEIMAAISGTSGNGGGGGSSSGDGESAVTKGGEDQSSSSSQSSSRNSSIVIPTTSTEEREFSCLKVRGQFRHEDEVLVGPRGPPPAAISATGPNSGRSAGGMSSSPQGFYVITPMVRAHNMGTVLINRGWVPRQYVQQNAAWNRPRGVVEIIGVPIKTEIPRFMSPPHDSKEPRQLLWFDRIAIERVTRTAGLAPLLLKETATTSPTMEDENAAPQFPVKPSKETVGEFKVPPSTHAGYAVTWYGLSGAGIFMTRKLMTRGRG